MSITLPNCSADTKYETAGGALKVLDCGVAAYRDMLALQYHLVRARHLGLVPDTVLCVEHPPVITFGARTGANRLKVKAEVLSKRGVELVETRRGGGATAHNPGQLVIYPILRAADFGLGVGEYIRRLEQLGAAVLAELGVSAEARTGFPGLWVGSRKIASIGVRFSKGISYHGMAINISNDLSIFDLIVPCGLEGVQVTSVLEQTGVRHSIADVKDILRTMLAEYFQRPADICSEQR